MKNNYPNVEIMEFEENDIIVRDKETKKPIISMIENSDGKNLLLEIYTGVLNDKRLRCDIDKIEDDLVRYLIYYEAIK
jgi:hypothetical protein